MADYVVVPVRNLNYATVSDTGYLLKSTINGDYRIATNAVSDNRVFWWNTSIYLSYSKTYADSSIGYTKPGVSSLYTSSVSVTHGDYKVGYTEQIINVDFSDTLNHLTVDDYPTLLDALNFIWHTPVVNPGVHVTFSPVYIPSFPGVHVQFNPVLTNPYAPGGDAEPGGGGGQFDNPTDPIGLPALPTHGVTDLIKLWNPSNADMVRLTELLFTDNIFTQAVRNLIGQPIDYIVSLGIVPVPLSIGSVSVPFTLAHQDAGFNMYGVAQQYMRWPCGSVQVPPYWNSFLDFEPHTSIQLYLPFIGFRDVLPSDVVGKTVTITYHIDVFTGACVAYVANEDTILYQHNGTCLSPIPFGAEQMQNLVSSVLGVLGSAATAGAVATGGFSAAIGRMMTVGAITGAASSVVNSFKHNTQHGGNAGSTVGLLSSRKPYFVLNRPRQAVASAQGTYSGFATWYTVESFGQLDGYTQVAECHLHDIPATDWELQEIERLLKEGVIF